MYRIGVTADFSAAHFLEGYAGSCEAVHGHNYRVEAVVEADEPDNIGLVMDFRAVRKTLGEIIGRLDHRLLNESPPFDSGNPSSENIARHIFDEMEKVLGSGPPKLVEVRVWETPGAWAAYRP